VLVPVVAAMVLLLLAGSALSELRAAQRLRGTLALESARAFWIAEAGLWHAAWLGAALPAPVAFAGGAYAVDVNAAEHRSTGTCGSAARVLTRSFTARTGPLDVPASVASAVVRGHRIFELDLVSVAPGDLRLASFAFAADAVTPRIDRVRLENADVWRSSAGAALPTGLLALNAGTPREQTVPAGERPRLRFNFTANLSGRRTFTLELVFTDGSRSTLVFTLDF
jgi:hypothetical protein